MKHYYLIRVGDYLTLGPYYHWKWKINEIDEMANKWAIKTGLDVTIQTTQDITDGETTKTQRVTLKRGG